MGGNGGVVGEGVAAYAGAGGGVGGLNSIGLDVSSTSRSTSSLLSSRAFVSFVILNIMSAFFVYTP